MFNVTYTDTKIQVVNIDVFMSDMKYALDHKYVKGEILRFSLSMHL